MASKTTLNAKNLQALGPARLAELLMELSAGDAAAKRRLRLELAGAQGPGDVAREVRRRLGQVARARGFVDWRRKRAFVDDLDAQRRAIVEKVAPGDPVEALDLLWRHLALAGPVHERCDDSDGLVGDLFRGAMADTGTIATAARPDPEGLAEQAFHALQDNGYGQYDGLIAALAPALGERGLSHLEARVEALAVEPVEPDEDEAEIVRWGPFGPVTAHEAALRERQSTVRLALMDIADARGDVDGFAAQQPEEARQVPRIAAAIAQRLLGAGRAGEALTALEAADTGGGAWVRREWHEARLAALDALGRGADAQAARWARFEEALSEEDSRTHLERLPDFEDIEAEDRALSQAARHPDALAALSFLVRWPAPERAAALVLDRADELDGDVYFVLGPAAEALTERHPLAATLTLRAMIDFSLEHARSSRYCHAARHLAECAHLAPRVPDWGPVPPHEAYLAGLRSRHGRKAGFWAAVEDAAGR